MSGQLEGALEELSPMQRACFRLYHGEGFARSDVAQMLGVTDATVGVHLHRARRALQVLLRGPIDETSAG